MAFRNSIGSIRRFSATAAQVGDHGEGTRMWKILTLAVALPSVAVTYVYANMNEKEDHELAKLNGRAPFVPYDHLRRRTTKFPWGDGNHGLFHNPHVNPLPEGYEADESH